MTGLGGLIGLLFGVGCHLVLVAFGPVRARAYVLRIEGFLAPARETDAWRTSRLLGERRARSVRERQLAAGVPADATAHLLALASWSSAGLAFGAIVVAVLTLAGALHSPSAALPFLAVCVVLGWLFAEHRLDRAVRRRRERAVVELPGIAESLAIAVGAGASLTHACELVAESNAGVLADALAGVVGAVAEGSTVDRALADMASGLPVPCIGRFVDAMRIALDRGTPIVDVLHAQAADARHESRRLLMERAGRREVTMLIPVVFLVLPAVVVIALFPGFRELTSMV